MQVTDEVVRDLLPLVAGGEASADSGALVDTYVREHPHLQRELDRLRGVFAKGAGMATLAPAVERQTLTRTKRLIRARSYLMAGAIFCSVLPFSFAYSNGEFRWLLLKEATPVAISSIVAAVGFWGAFFRADARLSARGF